MKSKLEYFIEEHRSEFDDAIPDENGWDNIMRKEKGSGIRKLFNDLSSLQIAASFILTLSGAAIVFLIITSPLRTSQLKNMDANSHAKPSSIEPNDNMDNDIRNMTSVIRVMQQEIKPLKNIDPELYDKFTLSQKQLNTYYQELQKELNNNPNKEQLLQAMIQNLNLQQELLNQQLSIIQNLKPTKNEKNIKDI